MSGLDLQRARVALRDRSVSDVLDLALRFLAVEARAYGAVALLSLAPFAALALAAGALLGWRWSWAIALPLAMLAETPFTVLASRLVFAGEVDARDVVRAALRDAPRVALVRLASLAALALGLLALAIPGLWLAAITSLLPEVLLLERSSAGGAFARSQRLAASATSEVIIGVLALGAIPIASVLLADVAGRALLGELLQLRPPPSIWSEGGGVLATLGLFAQVPYRATARLFLYLDVRTRAEGWDVQTRFAAIAARARPEEARRAARLGSA